MFGDEPQDRSKVAAAIARQAATPRAWSDQAYCLKRLADELIQRWHDALKDFGEIQRRHYEQFPHDYWLRRELQPGASVPPRPGERESEALVWASASKAAAGSPQVYMMLAGQAVENLVKGLYIKNRPEVVRTPQQVVNGAEVLRKPAQGHNTVTLLKDLGIELSETERNMAHRLSLAVRWHGRYPVPLKQHQSEVEQVGDDEESARLGYWSSTWRTTIDVLYDRLFAELVEPGWVPWWEPGSALRVAGQDRLD